MPPTPTLPLFAMDEDSGSFLGDTRGEGQRGEACSMRLGAPGSNEVCSSYRRETGPRRGGVAGQGRAHHRGQDLQEFVQQRD